MIDSGGSPRSSWLAVGFALIGVSLVAAEPPKGTPKVAFSEKHAATCLVKVGDAIPNVELLDGKNAVKLNDLRGGKPAVVVFWKGNHHARKEMLEDLAVIAKEQGAKLVIAAIHVGGAPAKPVAADPAIKQVVDDQGAGYATVAKGDAKMPRIYLLDATGAIIWMDIEYAVDTRRQLFIAVDALFPRANPAKAN